MERQSIGVEVLVWKHHPCVYIFDGPRNQVDLLEQLLDVNNNPAIRAKDDPGTARTKKTKSNRKKLKSNDCNKISVVILTGYNVYNYHIIMTVKIDSVQITSVRKAGLMISETL